MIALVAGLALLAGADLSTRVDAIFERYQKPYSPGAVVGILHRGEVVHLKGYGAANREFNVPWTPDTRYRIASITKGFVGHATVLLAERGLLDLDDPIEQHLTDFPSFDPPIRVRHLLTMTSGLWQDEWLLPLAGVTGQTTLDEMYQLSKRQDRLNYKPGTSYNYIDTNYRLMARIIETATGKSWPEAMAELIFRPLGMESTSAPPDFRQHFDRQGSTYLPLGDGSVPYRFEIPIQASGDGSILTTLNDLLRWLRHVREGFEEGTSVLDRLRGPTELTKGRESDYGFGVHEIEHRGLSGWAHAGATGTQWFFFPKIDLMVVFFINHMDVVSLARSVRSITDAFLRSDLNSDPSILAESGEDQQPAPLSKEGLASLSGLFIDPENGYYLESHLDEGRLRHSFIGQSVVLEPQGECEYQTASGVPLDVRIIDCTNGGESDLLVDWGDWPVPRRFVRMGSNEPNVTPADYVGDYYSSQLRSHWTVEEGWGGLMVRIGAGVQASQRFELRAVMHDIFTATGAEPETLDLFALPTLAVRFDRDEDGRVERLHVAIEKVQGLEFERR